MLGLLAPAGSPSYSPKVSIGLKFKPEDLYSPTLTWKPEACIKHWVVRLSSLPSGKGPEASKGLAQPLLLLILNCLWGVEASSSESSYQGRPCPSPLPAGKFCLDVLACLLPLPCWPYLPLIQTRILLCKQTWQVLPLRTHFFLYPSTFVLLGVRWLWKSLYEKLQRQLEHLLPGLSIPGSSQVTFSSKGPVQSNKLSAKASLVLPLGTFLE
jgi:hypothetical protein